MVQAMSIYPGRYGMMTPAYPPEQRAARKLTRYPGVPFTLAEAVQYRDNTWHQLGLGTVPPPRLIPLKAGDTPMFVPYRLIPIDEWRQSGPPETLREGDGLKPDRDGRPCIEVQNVILLPQAVLQKGLSPILAHEIHHARLYPAIAAAVAAGRLPQRSAEPIAPAYLQTIRASGLDRRPDLVSQGIYGAWLFASAEPNGERLMHLTRQVTFLEATGDVHGFQYPITLQAYKVAVAQYFSNPEELDAHLLYADLKGDEPLRRLLKPLKWALQTRNRTVFSETIDRLCDLRVRTDSVRARPFQPLKPYEVDALFTRQDENDQLRRRLGLA